MGRPGRVRFWSEQPCVLYSLTDVREIRVGVSLLATGCDSLDTRGPG